MGAAAAQAPWLEDWIAASGGAKIYLLGVGVEHFVERLCGSANLRRVRTITVLSDAGPINRAALAVLHHTCLRIVRTGDLVGVERSSVIIDLESRRTARGLGKKGDCDEGKLGEE